jgi:hypothetical protein
LNVRFAEWLMGLCPGWTDAEYPLAPTDYEAWVMVLSRSRLLSPYESF